VQSSPRAARHALIAACMADVGCVSWSRGYNLGTPTGMGASEEALARRRAERELQRGANGKSLAPEPPLLAQVQPRPMVLSLLVGNVAKSVGQRGALVAPVPPLAAAIKLRPAVLSLLVRGARTSAAGVPPLLVAA